MAPPPAPLPAQAVAATLGDRLGPHELRWRGADRDGPATLVVLWTDHDSQRSATWMAPDSADTDDATEGWSVHLPGAHLHELREAMHAAVHGPLADALATLRREDGARRAWRAAPASSPLGWPADARELPWTRAPTLHAQSRPWLGAWRRWAGAQPVLVEHPDGGPPSVRLPDPPPASSAAEQDINDGFFLDAAAHLLRHRAVAERFLALGYGCDDDGRIRTVPTPPGFAERAAALGLAPPFVPRLHRSRWALMRERRWLEAWASGEVAIHMVGEGFYRATAWMAYPGAQRLGGLRELWVGHHTGFAHDIGVHAGATHALPWAFGLQVRSRVRAALLQRGSRRVRSLTPLLSFFEDDLTERCLARWRAIGGGDFAADWQALDADEALATLERRVDEACAGGR